MSGLGDVLELIFARPDRWVPVHAVAREWQDRAVGDRVAKRFHESLPDQRMPLFLRAMTVPALAVAIVSDVGRRVRRPGKRPAGPSESELIVWLDATGRARLERVWAGGDERHGEVGLAGEQRRNRIGLQAFHDRRPLRDRTVGPFELERCLHTDGLPARVPQVRDEREALPA